MKNFPVITLAEFNMRAAEFRGNLAAANLLTLGAPEWKIFHVEDIAHDDCWLAPSDDSLPRESIYATNSIGGYLGHGAALFLLYGARCMLRLVAHLRQRYACEGPTAFARAGTCEWLAVLPHDPPSFNNPVQTFDVNFMLNIKSARVHARLLATAHTITIVHYYEGEQASHYKIHWDFFDESDYIQRAVVERIEQLDRYSAYN